MTTEVLFSRGRYHGEKGEKAKKKPKEKGRHRKGYNSKISGDEVELLDLSHSKLAHTNVRIS